MPSACETKTTLVPSALVELGGFELWSALAGSGPPKPLGRLRTSVEPASRAYAGPAPVNPRARASARIVEVIRDTQRLTTVKVTMRSFDLFPAGSVARTRARCLPGLSAFL